MHRTRHLFPAFFALLLLAIAVPAPSAQTIFVNGSANVYGAGHATPPDPGGTGAGTLPIEVPLPAGTGRVVTVSGASGAVDFGGCCPPEPPDGIPSTPVLTAIWDGLAGPFLPQAHYVAGVFLGAAEPTDPAPAFIQDSGVDFEEISPDVHQIFFVGDGLTGQGTGLTQSFFVPDTATRLVLGYIDCFLPCTVPGGYNDNSGGVSLTVSVSSATPTGSGAVPDGGVRPGVPLSVERMAGGELALDWESSCQQTDNDYAVYEGTVGDFTHHVPVVCGTGGVTMATVSPASGDTYYLVAPFKSNAHEGSHGLLSNGSERPTESPTCKTRSTGCQAM